MASGKINEDPFILWRAVDSDGYELDILLQKRRNKEAAVKRKIGNIFLKFLDFAKISVVNKN